MPDDRSAAASRLLAACAVALCAGTATAASIPPQAPLAITDVTIVDVEHGRSLGPRTVRIDHGRINAIDVADAATLPETVQRVDGRGRFLIPGLVVVPVLAGTDAPGPEVYPGWSLHDEMRLLVDSGLSPREALRAATLEPARLLGKAAESGSIAVGKRADLVLLAADPTRDIGNTPRIEAVVLDGRLWRREELAALLEEAAERER